MPTLSPDMLRRMDAYFRASNYLSVGQIYLYANPLLREPLKTEHIKPRLLGHWGTSPGLNLIYVHLNRAIVERDLSVIYITGPGHGGPSLVAHTYLEGSYSELYPDICEDESGMLKLFKQFSFPGGVPSHVRDLSSHLASRGWQVHVMVGKTRHFGIEQPEPGVTVYRFDRLRTLRALATLPGPRQGLRQFFPHLRPYLGQLGLCKLALSIIRQHNVKASPSSL